MGFLWLWPAGAPVAARRFLTEGAFLVAGLGLSSARTSVAVARRLESTGSVVMAHRLSCPVAHGIFLDQGSNLGLLHCKVDS